MSSEQIADTLRTLLVGKQDWNDKVLDEGDITWAVLTVCDVMFQSQTSAPVESMVNILKELTIDQLQEVRNIAARRYNAHLKVSKEISNNG